MPRRQIRVSRGDSSSPAWSNHFLPSRGFNTNPPRPNWYHVNALWQPGHDVSDPADAVPVECWGVEQHTYQLCDMRAEAMREREVPQFSQEQEDAKQLNVFTHVLAEHAEDYGIPNWSLRRRTGSQNSSKRSTDEK